MSKLLHFTLLYFILGLTFAHAEFNLFSIFGFGRPSHDHTRKSICSNTTRAQLYLNGTLAVINSLEANSTYNSTLQLQSPNFVQYLQNTTNQALLSTNCTVFLANLKAAQAADEAEEHKREHIASEIEQKFEQVIRSITGSNELY